MTDILHWDDMITTSITNIKNLLAKCKDQKTSKKDKEDWLSVNYGPSPYPGYFKHAFRGEDADDKKEKQEKLLSRIENIGLMMNI